MKGVEKYIYVAGIDNLVRNLIDVKSVPNQRLKMEWCICVYNFPLQCAFHSVFGIWKLAFRLWKFRYNSVSILYFDKFTRFYEPYFFHWQISFISPYHCNQKGFKRSAFQALKLVDFACNFEWSTRWLFLRLLFLFIHIHTFYHFDYVHCTYFKYLLFAT